MEYERHMTVNGTQGTVSGVSIKIVTCDELIGLLVWSASAATDTTALCVIINDSRIVRVSNERHRHAPQRLDTGSSLTSNPHCCQKKAVVVFP